MSEKCVWSYNEHNDYYDTECGEGIYFPDHTLQESHWKFCPYCGRKFEVKESEVEK